MNSRSVRLAACLVATGCCLLSVSRLSAADWTLTGNPELDAFFRAEVSRIEQQNSLLNYTSLDEWRAAKPRLRGQLFEMLGLDPLPERTDLHPTITGTTDETEFKVERLHFQSMPGLYVTGDLYLPRDVTEPLPAVLYVCGHASVKKDGISFGNKSHYQHHGAWFARNGYVCLVIDTLQLGEIEGIHHGTYRYDRWWWNSRGYTPAGVEAWNCIRALDYLQSRAEVDGSRLGVTGRSGGGAYSWWLSALDERIQCAVPVAGITSLRNHVVDGCVEGHCDCMYMLNAHQWDYATVAALVAPRPLLISNTDKDSIFPLEGVVDIHRQVRHIYELYGKSDRLGLQITEGPHKDTQELHIHAFRWMNRFLKQSDAMITTLAVPFFEPAQLRVFSALPADERNTTIDETFVAAAAAIPSSESISRMQNEPEAWFADSLERLRTRCFAAWPGRDNDSSSQTPMSVTSQTLPLASGLPESLNDLVVTRVSFLSQEHVPLFMDLIHRKSVTPSSVLTLQLLIADETTWNGYQKLLAPPESQAPAQRPSDFAIAIVNKFATTAGGAIAIFAPRGIGPHAWVGDAKKQIQIQRRFQLLGMTADGMRVWDIRRALQTVRSVTAKNVSVALRATEPFDLLCVCASLFEPPVAELHLTGVPLPPEKQSSLLNQARVLHEYELLALALLRTDVFLPATPASTGFVTKLTESAAWQGHKLQDATRFDTR